MWCLTKEGINLLKEKFRSGEITPESLIAMDSAQRHGYFASFLGDAAAKNLNAAFESKVLLKNQQRGILAWAKQAAGMTKERYNDIASKVLRMEKAMTAKDEDAFLHDLVERRLGADVTHEEAHKIFELSKVADESRQELAKDPMNKEKMIDYGNKLLDVNEYVDSIKPQGNPFLSFSNWWNLPKSALTSILHFSAPFVQGWGMLSTKAFWRAFPRMFKYFFNKQAYRDLNAYIISHPDYKLAIDAKLGLTKLGDKLSSREEAIQSSILEHLPGPAGELIKASNRAFTGFLNDVRFGRYVDLLDAARIKGEEVSKGSKASRDMADVVNNFTGRASLGPKDIYASSQPILNNMFFSPRKILATINMFNPVEYMKLSNVARGEAIKQLLGSISATYAILQLAHLNGAEVNFDPRSSEFGKMKFGKTAIDITGGNAIYIRFLARLISGEVKTRFGTVKQLGEGFKPETRADVLLSFFRNKLAPSAAFLADALYGKDPVGRPFNLPNEIQSKFIPIFMGSFIDVVRYDGANTSAYLASPLSALGAEMHTQQPPTSWVDSESKSMKGFKEKFGEETTQKANEEYQDKLQEWFDKVKDEDSFKNLSDEDKNSVIKEEQDKLRKQVLKEHGYVYKEHRKKKFSILNTSD